MRLPPISFYTTPESEEREIDYPKLLFDCTIIIGRAMLCSVLTPIFGNNQGMTKSSTASSK